MGKLSICLLKLTLYRLVLFHVIEVLPKEKKAREEKTNPIGQGVLDLSPLLRGTHVCLARIVHN